MISPIKLVTVFAATLLALVPSVSATCNVQDIGVWKGTYSSWNTTSNLLNYVNSPTWSSSISSSAEKPEPADQCNSLCSSNVVIRVTMETTSNKFYVSVNGQYLLTTYAWSSAMNSVPSNVLWIDTTTTKLYNSGTAGTFFTGLYWYRHFQTGYSWQPIYVIEFPSWQCPTVTAGVQTSMLNTIVIGNKIPSSPTTGSGCGVEYGTLKSKRTCTGGVRGDPQFSGLRGQDYQVHGIDGAIYNLITAPALSVTSRFVWLDGPRDCPIMPSTGQKSVACWAHKGSYLDNLAIINNAGAKILIQSGPASSGLASVEVDGQSVKMGASIEFGKGGESLHYNSTHEVTVVAGVFTMVIENSDGFVNLRSIGVKGEDWVQLKNDDTHGLLGQTWRKSTSKKVIEGRVDDYLVASGELFGSDFMYNRYQGAHA